MAEVIHLTLLFPLGLSFSQSQLILRPSVQIEFHSITNMKEVLAQSPVFSVVIGGPISYSATGSASAVDSGISMLYKGVHASHSSHGGHHFYVRHFTCRYANSDWNIKWECYLWISWIGHCDGYNRSRMDCNVCLCLTSKLLPCSFLLFVGEN